jgi:hypothetical protein
MQLESLKRRIEAEEKRIVWLCRSERARARCADRLALLVLALDSLLDDNEEAAREWIALAN